MDEIPALASSRNEEIIEYVPEPAPLRRHTILNAMALLRTSALFFAIAFTASAELPSSKVLDRYRQMLSSNPVEGTALDRLWKAYADAGKTAELIEQYRQDHTFPSEMVSGHLFRRAGQNDDARAAYERAAKLQPDSALPPLALARLHKEAGRQREAAESFENAAERLPQGDAQLADTLLEAGQAWISAGNVQKGAAAWERAVALAPDNAELRRRLADSYVANELAERAVPHLEHLIAHAAPSDRTQALQQLARVQQMMGNNDAAIQALEKAIALTTPGNWLREELQLQLIRIHQRAHRIPELEERWKRHVAENPRDLGGYLQMIALYERTADLEQERAWLEKLVKLAPKTPGYRLQLARLYVQLDQLASAATLYDQLLNEQPSNSELVFERARLSLLLGSPDDAKQRISALLQRSKNEESVRSKALEFFYQHRLWAAVEEHLTANASRGEEEPVIALAEFLFSQGRDQDAENQLRRLVRPDARPDAQAHGWIRIAQTLKAQGRFTVANNAVEQALGRLDSGNPVRREALILAGELRSALGQPETARPALAEAVAMSRTPAEQLDAEQKLFDCLRQLSIASGEASGRADELVLPPPDGGVSGPGMSLPKVLGDYVTGLRREAETQRTAAAWLRLARWYAWSRDTAAAMDAANKAVAIDPKAVAAHEFIVKLTSSAPTSVAPHWHLGKLAEIDPANRAQYQRRIAQLNIQAGNITDALRTLNELAKQQPGNVDVLTDLATAQQRAEQWEQSLATWQKVLTASPVSRKAEAVGPLLRVYERLHRPQAAAELLLKEVESKTDPKEQLERFTDLRDFCVKHQLLPWLRAEWEKRKKRLGDDYVTDVALGKILKAQGEKAAGFQLLVDASLSAPDPAVALPELVREAETSHKLDDAVRLQERLVRSAAAVQLDAWLKLAELQEKTFSFDQAGQTWSRIAARFPRDVGALMQASEFWQREGDSQKAADLLRRVRTLEPGNARALLSLAQLDLDGGNVDEATECLEDVLRHVPAQKSTEPIRLPGLQPENGSRLQSAYLATVRSRGGQPSAEAMRDLRSFWSDTPLDAKGNEKDLRLNAIRELARIVAVRNDIRAVEQWVQRWKTDASIAPTESLWALYYADAGAAAVDLVENLMRREPANVQNRQAFIWLALQTGQGARLAAWLRDPQRTASERDFLMIALGQHLDSRGEISPEMLEQLFPANASARLWQIASMFASRMRFNEAVKLGTRAFTADGAERSAVGLELAHWYLSTGDLAGARNILRKLSEEPADSFESPSCAAIRELYLLLPANERTTFVDQSIAALNGKPPVHAAIMGALLHGLAGNDGTARTYLDRLLQMRVLSSPPPQDESGNSTSRQWTFYLSAGLHLQAWKLGKLAAYLWERALADPSLIHLEGDQAREISREMRVKLAALKLALRTPQDAAVILDAVLRQLPTDDAIPVGEALESLGALPQAIALYRKLWEREPSDPQPLRNILNACRMADDQETMEEVLRICISGRVFPNDTVQRDFAGQLADLLDRKSDVSGAIKILTQATASAPQDSRLLQRLAQLHEKAGHKQEAETTWRQLLTLEPTHVIGRAALASLLEQTGDIPGALSVLERSDLTETDAQLPVLLLKNNQPDEAFEALERVPPAKLSAAAQNLANEFIDRDQRDLARAALQEALEHVSDPSALFQLRTRLVETFSSQTEVPIILHELRSLRRIARSNAALTGEYLAWLQRKARNLSAEKFAEEELLNAWANGKGLLTAGVALAGWHENAKDNAALNAVVTQLLARPDVNAQTLESLLSQLEDTAPPALTARVLEQLTKINPLEDQRVIDWARKLAKTGNRDAALGVLDRWGARAWLADDSAGKVAQAYVEFDANGKADALFAHAIGQDLPQRNFQAFLDYARLQRHRGNLPKAQYLLSIAFQQPACREYGEIIEWMAAANQLTQLDSALTSFDLAAKAATPLRQALFSYYEAQGKAAEALQVITAYPDVGTPPVLTRLRPLGNRSGAFKPCTEILEKWLGRAEDKDITVSSALALLYTDWADVALKSGQQGEALSHLQRAVAVRADLLPVAKRLAAFHERGGAFQNAVQVLERFMKASTNAAERKQAGKFVEKLRARALQGLRAEG